MSIIERIRVVGEETAALDQEGQVPDFHDPLEALKASLSAGSRLGVLP